MSLSAKGPRTKTGEILETDQSSDVVKTFHSGSSLGLQGGIALDITFS